MKTLPSLARFGSAVALVATTLVGVAPLAHAGAPKPPSPLALLESDSRGLHPVTESNQVVVGVAVSHRGRVFFAYSRAIDPSVSLSVAELKDGATEPFPRDLLQDQGPTDWQRLLSVQALTVDARDRLWILDTGKVGDHPVASGAPKLVAVDLASDQVVQIIPFAAEVAGPTSFLNDVRIDLSKGESGVAFITDCSPQGPTGIVVVDLSTGRSVRRLNNDPSTKPDPQAKIQVEGQPLTYRQGDQAGQPHLVGADGIALDADGHHLWYTPNSSRHLFRVDSDALADLKQSDAAVAATVEDLGDKGFSSDGLLEDSQGGVYLTDYEHNAIVYRNRRGEQKTVVEASALLWPDSMALEADGTLLFTCSQIERGPVFRGTDERIRPFRVWSVRTHSFPLFLNAPPQP